MFTSNKITDLKYRVYISFLFSPSPLAEGEGARGGGQKRRSGLNIGRWVGDGMGRKGKAVITGNENANLAYLW